MKHATFGEFWKDLNRRLEERVKIQAWTADCGPLGDSFQAFRHGPFLVADTPDARLLSELPQSHVERVWSHWHQYLKGEWLQEESAVSEFIISLVHWLESES
jgi:hypothetical protein